MLCLEPGYRCEQLTVIKTDLGLLGITPRNTRWEFIFASILHNLSTTYLKSVTYLKDLRELFCQIYICM